MRRWKIVRRRRFLAIGLVALGITACSQQANQAASAPTVEDKTFALSPATAAVRASFLTGELQGLQVTERVERETGKVVSGPQLRGTLRLKNTAEDLAVRLVTGSVTVLDRHGQPIRVAEGRGDAEFRFYSYQTDRLDPGAETTQSIDVPFPAAALSGAALGDLRLELTYVTLPYHEESVRIPVALGP
jgi:hypothetical protein